MSRFPYEIYIGIARNSYKTTIQLFLAGALSLSDTRRLTHEYHDRDEENRSFTEYWNGLQYTWQHRCTLRLLCLTASVGDDRRNQCKVLLEDYHCTAHQSWAAVIKYDFASLRIGLDGASEYTVTQNIAMYDHISMNLAFMTQCSRLNCQRRPVGFLLEELARQAIFVHELPTGLLTE